MIINKFLFFLIFGIVFFCLQSCDKQPKEYLLLEGETMGTFYRIKYQDVHLKNLKTEFDSLLAGINNSLSTYLPNSTISNVNQAAQPIKVDSYFKSVFIQAKKIHRITNGAFDPTVMPLVNIWGFGFEERKEVDTTLIDSLLKYVDFDLVRLEYDSIYKQYPQVMLDFSAIAKGFGIDILSEFLNENEVDNYMVEIGGEVRVKGKNPDNEDWQIGIEKPIENERILKSILSLKNMAVATSGNYRNFYYKNGKRYSHTIDPETGYMVEHNLLSASVLSKDCMTADAYATAFMVMGAEKAIELDEKDTSIMIYIIYENSEGELEEYCSEKLKTKVKAYTK